MGAGWGMEDLNFYGMALLPHYRNTIWQLLIGTGNKNGPYHAGALTLNDHFFATWIHTTIQAWPLRAL